MLVNGPSGRCLLRHGTHTHTTVVRTLGFVEVFDVTVRSFGGMMVALQQRWFQD